MDSRKMFTYVVGWIMNVKSTHTHTHTRTRMTTYIVDFSVCYETYLNARSEFKCVSTKCFALHFLRITNLFDAASSP